MNCFHSAFVATVCAVVLMGGSAAFAQLPTTVGVPKHQHTGEHKVTPEQKAASDQVMKNGLAQLQAAYSAMQSNNAPGVGNNLQSAIATMKQALPIYDGHREASIDSTEKALKAMQGHGRRAGERVGEHLTRAIQDAQAALQTN